MTQKDAAKVMGLGEEQVCRNKNGRHEPLLGTCHAYYTFTGGVYVPRDDDIVHPLDWLYKKE